MIENNQRDTDEDSSNSLKRGIDTLTADQQAAQDLLEADEKRNRGNYRCSRCNLPKKGHVCPFQPRYKRKEVSCITVPSIEIAIQTEMDENNTVRMLDLARQGLPDSYLHSTGSKKAIQSWGQEGMK